MFRSARPSLFSGVRYFAKRAEIKAPIQIQGLPGQYAHALFGIASTEDALEAVEKDLSTLKTAWESIPHFAEVMESPVIPNSQREPVLREALDKAGAHKLTKSFMRVVTDGGRTPILGNIIDDYTRLMKAHRKEVHAVLTSAEPLSTADVQKWTDTIKKEYAPPGSTVTISTKGVAFEMNNEYYDFSAKPLDTLIRKEWSDAISAYFDNKLREIENYEKTFDKAH